jgi:hypothetical protein
LVFFDNNDSSHHISSKMFEESLLELKRKNLLAELDKLTGNNEINNQPATTSTAQAETEDENDDEEDSEMDLSSIVGNYYII